MSAKPLKLFSVKDKKNPNAVPRLIKAESKTQVSKFLANSTSIDMVAPLDVAEIMSANPGTKVEDASAVLVEAGSSDAGGDAGGDGGGDAGGDAGGAPGAGADAAPAASDAAPAASDSESQVD